MRVEEQDWFPQMRARLGHKQLKGLGERLLEAKKKVPRSPAQPSALEEVVDAVVS